MPAPTMEGVVPPILPTKVGISYSGGGPQVLVELGCARAFVMSGIKPAIIAGVSAGALAGTAHALDVVNGTGITMAANLLRQMSTRKLGLNWLHVRWQLFLYLIRQKPRSLGDNSPIGQMIEDAIAVQFPGHRNVGDFNDPQLLVAATNRRNGTAHWYPRSALLKDALVASSAIPGVFPWRYANIYGQSQPVVDGGVVTNQPVSELVMAGCGKVYVCGVGYGGELAPVPTDLADNASMSIYMAIHQTMKLEEDYARLKIEPQGGQIIHIHPQVDFPVRDYDFAAEPGLIDHVMDDACRATLEHLATTPAS